MKGEKRKGKEEEIQIADDCFCSRHRLHPSQQFHRQFGHQRLEDGHSQLPETAAALQGAEELVAPTYDGQSHYLESLNIFQNSK